MLSSKLEPYSHVIHVGLLENSNSPEIVRTKKVLPVSLLGSRRFGTDLETHEDYSSEGQGIDYTRTLPYFFAEDVRAQVGGSNSKRLLQSSPNASQVAEFIREGGDYESRLVI
jgi:hypothetical protein